MSKLQLLYEKLMRIAYIFGGIFFLLSLIDFSAAMMSGAINTSGTGSFIDEAFPFYKVTIFPLVIATIVFIVTGFVFFKLAHQESDLLSVADYKRSLDSENDDSEFISREELYEKLRRGKRKKPVDQTPFFTRIKTNISDYFTNTRDNMKKAREERKQKAVEREEMVIESKRLEEEKYEQEKLMRARTKLNKTGLILLLNKNTELSQSNSRLFINTLFDVIKETVVNDEEVKITKFGTFKKEHIEEHIEIDPDTEVENTVEEHNTVVFNASKQFVSKVGGTYVEEEDLEEEKEEPVVEKAKDEPQDEIKEEPVVEETKDEPKEEIKEEPKEEIKEEPVVEETKDEPKEEIKEEPVVEETKDEPQEEIKEEPIVEETKEEPQEEAKEESVVEEAKEKIVVVPVAKVEKAEEKEEPKETIIPPKPAKPKKPKVVTKTKTDFIAMIDETTDLSKNKANKFLKFFANVVKEQLAERNDVELEGIGFFTTIEMPAKEAVNPQTGQKIIVPAHHQVRLRFDEDLKEKMNELK